MNWKVRGKAKALSPPEFFLRIFQSAKKNTGKCSPVFFLQKPDLSDAAVWLRGV